MSKESGDNIQTQNQNNDVIITSQESLNNSNNSVYNKIKIFVSNRLFVEDYAENLKLAIIEQITAELNNGAKLPKGESLTNFVNQLADFIHKSPSNIIANINETKKSPEEIQTAITVSLIEIKNFIRFNEEKYPTAFNHIKDIVIPKNPSSENVEIDIARKIKVKFSEQISETRVFELPEEYIIGAAGTIQITPASEYTGGTIPSDGPTSHLQTIEEVLEVNQQPAHPPLEQLNIETHQRGQNWRNREQRKNEDRTETKCCVLL